MKPETNNKLILWILAIVLAISVLGNGVQVLRERNTVKQYTDYLNQKDKTFTKYRDSVQESAALLGKKEDSLVSVLDSVNRDYTLLLSKTQDLHVADSLQKEEIRKGKLVFGDPGSRQHQTVLAATYGNQAFDNLELTKSRLDNQKKVASAYYGIVQSQDTLLMEYRITVPKIIEASKPNFWERLKEWIIAAFVGGGFVLML
jgi:hypothetical protein